jgi:PPOX class probable F420-dependent enzyme
MDLTIQASREFLALTFQNTSGAQNTVALWFVVDGQRIVTVLTDKRPAKSIDNHPEVRIAFADNRREISSKGAPAIALRLNSSEHRRVRELLNRKYGWRRRSFRLLFWFIRNLGSTAEWQRVVRSGTRQEPGALSYKNARH